MRSVQHRVVRAWHTEEEKEPQRPAQPRRQLLTLLLLVLLVLPQLLLPIQPLQLLLPLLEKRRKKKGAELPRPWLMANENLLQRTKPPLRHHLRAGTKNPKQTSARQ